MHIILLTCPHLCIYQAKKQQTDPTGYIVNIHPLQSIPLHKSGSNHTV